MTETFSRKIAMTTNLTGNLLHSDFPHSRCVCLCMWYATNFCVLENSIFQCFFFLLQLKKMHRNVHMHGPISRMAYTYRICSREHTCILYVLKIKLFVLPYPVHQRAFNAIFASITVNSSFFFLVFLLQLLRAYKKNAANYWRARHVTIIAVVKRFAIAMLSRLKAPSIE